MVTNVLVSLSQPLLLLMSDHRSDGEVEDVSAEALGTEANNSGRRTPIPHDLDSEFLFFPVQGKLSWPY